MSIVRPITRPVTRPPTGYVVGGDFDPGLIARRSEAIFDDSDLTSLFVGRDGSGGNTAPSGVVGLQLDKSEMGGMTAAAYIDSRPNYNNSGTAASATNSGSGNVYELTATAPFPRVEFADGDVTPGEYWYIDFTWSGNDEGSIVRVEVGASSNFVNFGTGVSGTGTVFIKAGSDAARDDIRIIFSGHTASDTGNLTVNRISKIPGQHRTAAADNERPVLDLTNGVYSLDYDGVDDGMSFDFEGGAGPADCSVFYAENTGSGWVLVEDKNQDYSGVSSLSMADIVGATPNGKYIGPIIVETSKLTNSLRRSIETYLKRKAGIL